MVICYSRRLSVEYYSRWLAGETWKNVALSVPKWRRMVKLFNSLDDYYASFFHFCQQYYIPYVFPSLPAFALFFAEILNRLNLELKHLKWIFISSLLCGVLFLAVAFVFSVKPNVVPNTHKPIITAWLNQNPTAGSYLVYWGYKTDFSAEFYSEGQVKAVKNSNDLCKLISNRLENYLVINSKETQQIREGLLARFTLIDTFRVHRDTLILFYAPVLTC